MVANRGLTPRYARAARTQASVTRKIPVRDQLRPEGQ